MPVLGKFTGIPGPKGQQTIPNRTPCDPVIRHRTEHLREQTDCANPHPSELRIPVNHHARAFEIHLLNHLIRQIGNQTLALVNRARRSVHHQDIIGACLQKVMHLTQALTFRELPSLSDRDFRLGSDGHSSIILEAGT